MKTSTRSAALAAVLAAVSCSHPQQPKPSEPQTSGPAADAPRTEPSPAPPAATAAPEADRSQPPALGPNPPLDLPAQRHFTLANGLRVRLVEQHRLPIVAFDLVVDAGAARDPADLPGLASFTADMLTEGTRSRTATQLSDALGFLGASIEAAAAPDSATLGGATLSEHLPAFLELFADVARNPAFPAADFERVQDERRVTLIQQRDQPAMVAARAFVSLFWGSHPYGHPLLGTEAAVERTSRQDLARFHGRYWVPANAELVAVGDVTEAELRPLLEKTLGPWAPGQAAASLPPRGPAAPHRTLLIDKPGAPQSYLSLGLPGLDRRSDDYVEATVMFEVLGGGMSSRLFRKLREEKGYTYGIGAGADARRLAGASVVRGSVKAEVTGAALGDLLAELQRMRDEPVPADELAEAKNGIVRSMPGRFSTVGGIAGQLAVLSVHGLPDDYWSTYTREVEQVTAADVQRIARKYLDPQRLTLVVVGARGLVEPQLAPLPIGKVELDRTKNPSLPRKPGAKPPARAGGAVGLRAPAGER